MCAPRLVAPACPEHRRASCRLRLRATHSYPARLQPRKCRGALQRVPSCLSRRIQRCTQNKSRLLHRKLRTSNSDQASHRGARHRMQAQPPTGTRSCPTPSPHPDAANNSRPTPLLNLHTGRHRLLPSHLLRQQSHPRRLLLQFRQNLRTKLPGPNQRKNPHRHKIFLHAPKRAPSRMEIRGNRWLGRAHRRSTLPQSRNQFRRLAPLSLVFFAGRNSRSSIACHPNRRHQRTIFRPPETSSIHH
jgi:hypothetical protein